MVDHFGKVAVLMGGQSAEREVSLKSGQAVLDALLRQNVNAIGIDADKDTLLRLQTENFDRVFIVLHGRWGEDGTIQGGLEAIGMPYTGAGVTACALAMDKVLTKRIWQSYGLPTASFCEVKSADELEGLTEKLGLPLYVKASHEGSSVGVIKVLTSTELEPAWQSASQYDESILIESFNSGDELTVGILDGKALPVIRIVASNEFYDFDAKYESNQTQYICPAGLTDEKEAQIRELAESAFVAVQGTGWGRVDIMLNESEEPQLLEVNMVPGMTDHSLVPMAAKAVGMSFDDLVLKILEDTLNKPLEKLNEIKNDTKEECVL